MIVIGSRTICDIDDTTLLYMALNFNVYGLYSNNRVNNGRPYVDKYDPYRFEVMKIVKHKNDTAYVSFRIFGKNNASIMCLEPNHLITGFKIYNNKFSPLFGLDNVRVSLSPIEFQEILNTRKLAFTKFCDSISNLK
jgi:hypothetical protein